MLWYVDYQFEWIARGHKITRDHTSKPIGWDAWKEAQAEANRTGRIVTVYEMRPCRWNNTRRRKRRFRVRPTTRLRFMLATDPPKPRPSDAARRRAHRNAARAGQMSLSIPLRSVFEDDN